jgi:hypothetical protein
LRAQREPRKNHPSVYFEEGATMAKGNNSQKKEAKKPKKDKAAGKKK